MRSILAQYSAAETSTCAALVADAVLLDQASTVDLSAALDASGATLSGSAICFTVQSLSSSPGDSYDAALKTQRTWLDEWSNFYVDLWVNANGAPVVSVDASFTCGADCFALVGVEAAGGYSIEYSTNAGTTSVVATKVGASDSFGWTIVARMKYAPVDGLGIPTAEDGVFAPVDAGFSADLASQTVNGAVVETVSAPNPALYPFLFDVDENGVVNTNDLGYFLSYVGQNVDEIAYPKYRVLDYDHSGTINTNDLAYFLQYLGVSAGDELDAGYRAEPSVGDPIVLDAPSVVSTSSGKDYITVAWDSVPNAAHYGVAYKLASDATWTVCDAGPDLRYAITGLQADSEYSVRLITRGSGGRYADSAWSDPVVVKTKNDSFLSSAEYDDLRRRYNELQLPESLADVNIVVPTDWTAAAIADAIEVARSTSVDDVVLLDPEQYSDAILDLSDVSITLDLDYQTSGAISILSRRMDRAQLKANDSVVTFDAVDGLTQFGGFDFVDVNPDVSVYQVTAALSIGAAPATVETQSVGAYTSAGVSVGDASLDFVHGMAPNVSATPSANDYALLFIGGYDKYQNYNRYYDTLVDYYYELVEDFSLDPTKIYILYADGDVTGASYNLNLDSYYYPSLSTSDMTFATSVGSSVRAATGDNLTATLGEIANLMTTDSHLLFWTYDHGRGEENKPSDYGDYLCGWGEDIDGSTVRDALFQIKQGYVTCVFTQCFSGGILDDIFDPSMGTLSNLYAGSAHFVGGAATNHYEPNLTGILRFGGYVGYSQTFEEALRQCSTGVDAFIYTEQNSYYSVLNKMNHVNETYSPNKGIYTEDVQHPWHVGETFSIFATAEPSAPTIMSHLETSNSISLTWTAVEGATSYSLEYVVADSSDVITVGNISKTSYTVTGLTPATNYAFRVKANNSSYSVPLSVWTQSPDVQETPSTVVTTDSDVVNAYDGLISLREAITKYSVSGDVITFDPSLRGKTINLDPTRGQFYVNKSLTIDATNLLNESASEPGLTISGQEATRILYLSGNFNVEINAIALKNGYSDDFWNGGAISNFGATLSLNNCTLTNNFSNYCGGAIYNNNATLSLNNCAICDNEASLGGGVYSYKGETTLTNCVGMNNSANYSGGAIYNNNATLSLNNCAICDNEASFGGGVYSYDGETTLTNCTITNNSASLSDGGGGVELCQAGLIAYNTIIVENSAPSSSNADVRIDSESVASAYNTLSSYSNWKTSANNIAYDSSKPLFTNAATGDYTLANSSQAINKGNNQYVTASVDLAGNARIVGGTVDLGAYELQSATAPTTLSTPTNPRETAKTETTITVAWDAVSNANGYKLAWRNMTASEFAYVSLGASTTFYKLTELDNGATYYWQVLAEGDGINYTDSVYTATRTVKPRQKLANPTVSSDVEGTSITLSWDAVSSASGYSVSYKLASATNWSNDVSVGTKRSFSIDGLEPNAQYNVRVRAIGDGVDYANSDYAILTVTTSSNPYQEIPSTVVTTVDDVVDSYDGKISLREALDYAESGDTITFANSLKGKMIALDSELGELYVNKSITIDASNLRNATTSEPGLTISGQGATRILSLNKWNANLDVEINWIALINGYSEDVSGGGAICNFGATLSLNSCTITNNSAKYNGGAIYNNNAKLSLNDCVISDNKANYGGGVYSNGYETTLTSCALMNNSALVSSGGAIYYNGSMLSLSDCVINGNEASTGGGGVYSTGGEATLTNCVLTNNLASVSDGGGMSSSSEKTTLVNCLVAGNSVGVGDGGGLELSGNATLYNCTITGNTASWSGGGVNLSGNVVLTAYNTIIAGNSASSATDNDVYFYGSNAVVNAYNTLSSYSKWTRGKSNLTYIKSKPLFTNAASGDYTLAKNSQAISKGNNQYVTESVDLVGKARIVGGTVDLGAYEYQSASSALFDEDAELFNEMEDSLDLIAASLLEKR